MESCSLLRRKDVKIRHTQKLINEENDWDYNDCKG